MALREAFPLYQHRGLSLTVAPSAEPVTAPELHLHMRTSAAEFPDAGAYITDARTEIENRTGLAFLTQSWRLSLDRWPTGGEAWWDGTRDGSIAELYSASQRSVAIPKWPLASITSLKTYDEDGNATTFTAGDVFDVDLYSTPGRLTVKRGQTWPVAMRANNAIEIVFVAGYTSAANVPAPLKRAVKQLAAYNYSHRGDECDPADAYRASGAEAIMRQYQPMGL